MLVRQDTNRKELKLKTLAYENATQKGVEINHNQ